ncbi:MAG TPA: hypothetical protein VKV19_20520 [Ktedonobacteraceae bacterium]|nr:hypothetical protein [Ktedonobacteraceae bacterium]
MSDALTGNRSGRLSGRPVPLRDRQTSERSLSLHAPGKRGRELPERPGTGCPYPTRHGTCIADDSALPDKAGHLYDVRKGFAATSRMLYRCSPCCSNPVPHAINALIGRAICTAVEDAVDLYTMTDNSAVAMVTNRGQAGHGALKAIKDMFLPGHDNLEGFIVVIAALFTLGHTGLSFFQTGYQTCCK